MYITDKGEKVFVMDGHTHLWDARKDNRKNRYGSTGKASVGFAPDSCKIYDTVQEVQAETAPRMPEVPF